MRSVISTIGVSADHARVMRRGLPWAGILTLSVALLGSSFTACADARQGETPPEGSSEEKKDPRWEGRLRPQTEVEEQFARNWKPPTGDSPVFTQNYTTWYVRGWHQYLDHLKGQPNVKALEIGSFEGRSAIWFADNILTGPGATITCVDIFGERLDLFFDHNVKVSGHRDKIIKVKGKSQYRLYDLADKETYDFIYVDGCHLATCALIDIILSWHLLKQDGILIMDDYEWAGPTLDRPRIAIDAFLEIFEPHLELLQKGQQVFVRKNSTGY